MKYINIKSLFTTLALLGVNLSTNIASATIIDPLSFVSGEHTYGPYDTEVKLQSLEWMPLDYSAGISRNTVEDLNGWLDNYGNYWASDEWRYATRFEAETMVTSLWAGVYSGWSNESYHGAKWFSDNFGLLGYDTWDNSGNRHSETNNDIYWDEGDYGNWMFGDTFECSTSADVSCYGHISLADGHYNPVHGHNIITKQYEVSAEAWTNIADMHDQFGINLGSTPKNSTVNKNRTDLNSFGSLLVRKVPEPHSMTLFMLGIIGLSARRINNSK